MSAMRARQTVQSVERCLDLLEAVAAAPGPVGVSALARQLGLSKATAHRLCHTLVDRHFLQQDLHTGRYSPGLRLLDVTSRLLGHFDLSRASRPTLEQMAGHVRENAFAASVVGSHELLVYDEVRIDNPIQPRSLLGLRMPLHNAPGGLLTLACLDDDRLRAAAEQLARSDGQVDSAAVQHIIDNARSLRGRDYCVQPGIPHSDVTVICSPVTDRHSRVLGVLGYCFPSLRAAPPDHETLGRTCATAARSLSSLFQT